MGLDASRRGEGHAYCRAGHAARPLAKGLLASLSTPGPPKASFQNSLNELPSYTQVSCALEQHMSFSTPLKIAQLREIPIFPKAQSWQGVIK